MIRLTMPRRLFGGCLATGSLVLGLTAPVAAQPTPAHLADHNWDCFSKSGYLHCTPDLDSVVSGEAETASILTFAPDGTLLGTEFLIREDLYHGQPCPTDLVNGASRDYLHLSELGSPLPYYVCHRFDSPNT